MDDACPSRNHMFRVEYAHWSVLGGSGAKWSVDRLIWGSQIDGCGCMRLEERCAVDEWWGPVVDVNYFVVNREWWEQS